jgi:hypothetical protein
MQRVFNIFLGYGGSLWECDFLSNRERREANSLFQTMYKRPTKIRLKRITIENITMAVEDSEENDGMNDTVLIKSIGCAEGL